MKNSAAIQKPIWQNVAPANSQQTMLGAEIAWRKISDAKGRGVFAMRDIAAGDVIEIAPVITVSKKNVKENGEAPDGYLLQWDADKRGEEYCMPLGYIMMYNHSAKPTLLLENDMENYTITAKAARHIKAGEELTWNYACDLWFDDAA